MMFDILQLQVFITYIMYFLFLEIKRLVKIIKHCCLLKLNDSPVRKLTITHFISIIYVSILVKISGRKHAIKSLTIAAI